MRHIVLIFLATIIFFSAFCQVEYPKILSMEDRAVVIDGLLDERIETVLPTIMRRSGIDMWVIISREYNEDPVIKTFLPATWLSARRRTILVVYDPGSGQPLETLAIARYGVGKKFKQSWNKEKQPDQWARLAEIINERNPKKIGVNKSLHFGLADGISSTDLNELTRAIGKKNAAKIVSAEKIAIGWLETRTLSEMVLYRQICQIAHQMINEAFSEKVIQPGVTSTDDVVWWLREKVRELNLVTWFHPSVSIQRGDKEKFDQIQSFTNTKEKNTIYPGDLLHVDFGITYLRLNTDTQQHAYVLKPDESSAPSSLMTALSTANQLQDIFTRNFKAGATGNEVLKKSREDALSQGLKPSIYTHPLGYHGHAAGPTLGMWDAQGGVPFTGDYPLYYNTAYSIELNAEVDIPEWGKSIRIMLEEDAFFDKSGVRYIDGRQQELLLIPRQE